MCLIRPLCEVFLRICVAKLTLRYRYFADPEFCCTFYDCSNSIPTRMECTTRNEDYVHYKI